MEANEDFVSIEDLACEFGIDKSNVFKYLKKHGIHAHKRRLSGHNSQKCACLNRDEAEQIRKMRASEGYSHDAQSLTSGAGSFYVIRLVPDLDPRRIKLGFANDINQRLVAHRCSAPTAEVVKTWPCKASWERTAIDCLSNGLPSLSNEVFVVEDLEKLIGLGDKFFGIMPDPSALDRR